MLKYVFKTGAFVEQFRAPIEQGTPLFASGEDQTALPRWQVLEADLKVVDAQIDGVEFDFTQDPQYTPHFDRLWETEKALENTLGRQPSRREIIEALETPLPEAMHIGLMSFIALSEERETLLSEIDTHKAEKYAAIVQKVADYERLIDYDKVLEAAIDTGVGADGADPFHPSVSMHFRLRVDTEKATYQGLLNLEDLLDDDFKALKKQGLTLDVPEVAPTPDDTRKEMSFIASAEGFVTEIERLQNAYRNIANRDEPHWQKIRTITKLYKYYMRTHSLTNADPADFRAAQHRMLWSMGSALDGVLKDVPPVDKSLSTQSEAYKDFCEKARSIDVQSAIENIEFKGATPETDVYLSQDEIKDLLWDDMMPLATASIRKITFEDIAQDDESGIMTLAFHEWDETLKGSVITICPQQLQEDYAFMKGLAKDLPDPHGYAFAYVKQRLRKTLRHELSHTLHNVLPYAALKRWDDVTKLDKTPVSNYVHRKRTANKKSADIEDFADSVAYRTTHPLDLAVLSPLRHMEVDNLYEDLYPDFQSSKLRQRLNIFFNLAHKGITDTGLDLIDYRAKLLAEITGSSGES